MLDVSTSRFLKVFIHLLSLRKLLECGKHGFQSTHINQPFLHVPVSQFWVMELLEGQGFP